MAWWTLASVWARAKRWRGLQRGRRRHSHARRQTATTTMKSCARSRLSTPARCGYCTVQYSSVLIVAKSPRSICPRFVGPPTRPGLCRMKASAKRMRPADVCTHACTCEVIVHVGAPRSVCGLLTCTCEVIVHVSAPLQQVGWSECVCERRSIPGKGEAMIESTLLAADEARKSILRPSARSGGVSTPALSRVERALTNAG